MEHSRLSASSSSRWLKCPGSIRLSMGIEQPPPHPSARIGSVVHAIGEDALRHYIRGEQYDFDYLIGTTMDDVDVDREMLMGARAYYEYVISLLGPEDYLSLEQRVYLKYIHADLWGTSDAVIEHKDGSISIVDLKFGEWPVDAKENPQMIYYFLGARNERTVPYGTLHIFQPRSRDGKKIKAWRFEKDQFEKWERLFKEKAFEADLGTPIVRGSWCRFCPAKSVCQLHKE